MGPAHSETERSSGMGVGVVEGGGGGIHKR